MSYQKIPTATTTTTTSSSALVEGESSSQSQSSKRNILSLIVFGVIVLAFFVLFPTFQQGNSSSYTSSNISPDNYYNKAIHTISQMHFALDTGDWETFKSCFDDSGVSMEYMGIVSITMTPEELVDMVKPDIESSIHSHHQLGNFVVNVIDDNENDDEDDKKKKKGGKYQYPDKVRVLCYLTASFQFETQVSIFYATYDMVLTYKDQDEKYVVSSGIFHPKWQSVNEKVNITSF